jgi:HD-like signal output (HDOD) protein
MSKDTNCIRAAREFIAEMAEQISMPDVYLDVRELIEEDDSKIEDFVKVIKNDSLLSGKIARITDSQYFGFPRRAEDLYQAVSLIGFMQLHDLMLNNLSLRTFSAVPSQIFNLEAFWLYSIRCGIAARTIAQHAQIMPINPYFTYGLLHEIGHAAMFVREPELSLQALEGQENNLESQIEKERELFGFDYTHVGAALIRQWRLPEVYQQVAAFHLHVEDAHELHQQAVRVTHLAHMVCQSAEAQNIGTLFENSKKADLQLAKLPDNIIEIIPKEIEANADTVLDMLWPNFAKTSTTPSSWPTS